MSESPRDIAVNQWIAQLRAGTPPPLRVHESTRVYFPATVLAAEPGTCAVCGAVLVGQQMTVCADHWDWLLFTPLEEFEYEVNPAWSIVEFLEIFVRGARIFTRPAREYDADWGPLRCEVCDGPTDIVEEMSNGSCYPLKWHMVCPIHAFLRSTV